MISNLLYDGIHKLLMDTGDHEVAKLRNDSTPLQVVNRNITPQMEIITINHHAILVCGRKVSRLRHETLIGSHIFRKYLYNTALVVIFSFL